MILCVSKYMCIDIFIFERLSEGQEQGSGIQYFSEGYFAGG